MPTIYWTVSIMCTGFLIIASISSFIHRENRAGGMFLFIFAVLSVLYLLPLLFSGITVLYNTIMLLFTLFTITIFLFPLKGPGRMPEASYGVRFHEADSVLSRRRLVPGTEDFKAYYKENPQFREADDKARKNPGLLSPASHYYEPVTFAAAAASFRVTEHLHELDGVPYGESVIQVDDHKITNFIRDWLKRSGASGVGFTKLKEHHLYSHKGRGEKRGDVIRNDHPYAIAFTVEMDPGMMQYAPAGPTVMESAGCYLSSGTMATSLALMIRELGYAATPHIDGNYEVICPLVASDAGLGEIGRMGLLMTPRQGPRVRIAVVTTDLPLVIGKPKTDPSVIDFCKRCRKCADVCPASAIPSGDMKHTAGSLRWRINSEKCYHYWTISGTDCGRCVISCPYSHPDHWLHRFTRWGIKNNLLFRIMAVKLDDVFYGRKPFIKGLPDRYSFRTQS